MRVSHLRVGRSSLREDGRGWNEARHAPDLDGESVRLTNEEKRRETCRQWSVSIAAMPLVSHSPASKTPHKASR